MDCAKLERLLTALFKLYLANIKGASDLDLTYNNLEIMLKYGLKTRLITKGEVKSIKLALGFRILNWSDVEFIWNNCKTNEI